MAITAAQVKELREMTGAGMMDAKKALVETDGDLDAAVDWLRTKGLAKAAKKAGRTAAEGLVAVKVEGGTGVAVETVAAAGGGGTDVDVVNTGVVDGSSELVEIGSGDVGGPGGPGVQRLPIAAPERLLTVVLYRQRRFLAGGPGGT